MITWSAVCILGMIAVGAALLLHCEAEQRRERNRLRSLRYSDLYQALLPTVDIARRCELDQVRVEPESITFTRVYPSSTVAVFHVADVEMRPMSVGRTRVMAMALARELPELHDTACYRMRRYRITRPNGTVEYGYVYTITHAYKDAIMRGLQQQGAFSFSE